MDCKICGKRLYAKSEQRGGFCATCDGGNGCYSTPSGRREISPAEIMMATIEPKKERPHWKRKKKGNP